MAGEGAPSDGIVVVSAEHGDWSDQTWWPVGWLPTETEAREYVASVERTLDWPRHPDGYRVAERLRVTAIPRLAAPIPVRGDAGDGGDE